MARIQNVPNEVLLHPLKSSTERFAVKARHSREHNALSINPCNFNVLHDGSGNEIPGAWFAVRSSVLPEYLTFEFHSRSEQQKRWQGSTRSDSDGSLVACFCRMSIDSTERALVWVDSSSFFDEFAPLCRYFYRDWGTAISNNNQWQVLSETWNLNRKQFLEEYLEIRPAVEKEISVFIRPEYLDSLSGAKSTKGTRSHKKSKGNENINRLGKYHRLQNPLIAAEENKTRCRKYPCDKRKLTFQAMCNKVNERQAISGTICEWVANESLDLLQSSESEEQNESCDENKRICCHNFICSDSDFNSFRRQKRQNEFYNAMQTNGNSRISIEGDKPCPLAKPNIESETYHSQALFTQKNVKTRDQESLHDSSGKSGQGTQNSRNVNFMDHSNQQKLKQLSAKNKSAILPNYPDHIAFLSDTVNENCILENKEQRPPVKSETLLYRKEFLKRIQEANNTDCMMSWDLYSEKREMQWESQNTAMPKLCKQQAAPDLTFKSKADKSCSLFPPNEVVTLVCDMLSIPKNLPSSKRRDFVRFAISKLCEEAEWDQNVMVPIDSNIISGIVLSTKIFF